MCVCVLGGEGNDKFVLGPRYENSNKSVLKNVAPRVLLSTHVTALTCPVLYAIFPIIAKIANPEQTAKAALEMDVTNAALYTSSCFPPILDNVMAVPNPGDMLNKL